MKTAGQISGIFNLPHQNRRSSLACRAPAPWVRLI
jgi:hypothetical protein